MTEPTIRRRILQLLLRTEFIALPTSGGVDAAILRASKQLNAEAIKILYGENRFIVYRPDVLLEWLNMIGDNATKVRHLSFSLTTGNSRDTGVPNERLWLGALIRLAPLQQLTALYVDFTAWQPFPPVSGLNRITLDQRVAEQARDGVVNLVDGFKNQGLNPVFQNNGAWLFMRAVAVPL